MDNAGKARLSVGWLWFDDDPKVSVEAKIAQAAGRFQQKFGQAPRLCYVNARTLAAEQAACGPIQVVSATNVLPGHFLFVVEGAAV